MLTEKGLSMGGVTISLDDALTDTCFVSHAHSDHTAAFEKLRKGRSPGMRIIASPETFAIVGRDYSGHSFPGVSLHRAGHMLGARSLFAEADGGTFAYTGDFSLHDSYTSKGAEILRCDTLMLDSTYCLPHLRFPDRIGILSKMEKFVKQNQGSIIVFGAYTTGKTQELVKFLNKECSIAPIVKEKAARVCAAYEKCGVRLDYFAAGSEQAEEAMRSPFVAILPPSEVNFAFGAKLSEAHNMPVKTAVATGWAQVSRFPTDAAFALSDHADFKETMEYINSSGAKRIICANSNSEAAAAALRNLGYNAQAKSEIGAAVQTTLATS
jgi:putative mRNA 3-end processing factor